MLLRMRFVDGMLEKWFLFGCRTLAVTSHHMPFGHLISYSQLPSPHQSHLTQRYESSFRCYVNNRLRLLMTDDEYDNKLKATMKRYRSDIKQMRGHFYHRVYLSELALKEKVIGLAECGDTCGRLT